MCSYHCSDPIEPIAHIDGSEILAQDLILRIPHFDDDCPDSFAELLDDGPRAITIVCVLRILFSDRRSTSHYSSSLDILPETRDLRIQVDSTMFVVSRILDLHDIPHEIGRERSRVEERVASGASLVGYYFSCSILEYEMTIGCIRVARYCLIDIYHKKGDECKESKRDDNEDFFHRSIISTKNLLTNTIFRYNRLTSIGDSRLLTRHKNTLPRWTVRS